MPRSSFAPLGVNTKGGTQHAFYKERRKDDESLQPRSLGGVGVGEGARYLPVRRKVFSGSGLLSLIGKALLLICVPLPDYRDFWFPKRVAEKRRRAVAGRDVRLDKHRATILVSCGLPNL